ncbi:MAG: TonB-dependent receptor [Rikenellaceae bacterium]|nr:TonB-dependent receptor [Rikenellaceae bacterium]
MKKRRMERSSASRILIILLALLAPMSLLAQGGRVSGVVTDADNAPVSGVVVSVMGANTSVLTGADGRYDINPPQGATLVFTLLGYNERQEQVGSRTVIDVRLEQKTTTIDDVVVVGYGTQRRGSITGAVASVKGGELRQTRNENPQNMLTGRLAGLRVWQKSAEPGTYNNEIDIRGFGGALVVIDGIPREMADFQRLNAEDIEDISILKDATAAIYGVRGGNGVLLVTTKRGKAASRAKVSYNGAYTLQVPSNMPKLAGPFDAMTLVNESRKNSTIAGPVTYGEDDFAAYADGRKRAGDWNSELLSDFAPQQRHDVSVSGGSEKSQYYVSLGYFEQDGIFKSGDLNYNKFNLRSNITTNLLKGLDFNLNLSGMVDQENKPYDDVPYIIRAYWRQGSLYPVYADPEKTMLSYEGLEMEENPVAMSNSDISGYRRYEKKQFASSAELSYDFGTATPILQGLSGKALYSFDYQLDDNTKYRKEYNLYAWNDVDQAYLSNLYEPSYPTNLKREAYFRQQSLLQLLLNYKRTFAEVHHVSGVFGLENQKRQRDNFYAQRDLTIDMGYLFTGDENGQQGGMYYGDNDIYEIGNSALIGKVNYSYADRYLLEAQFRYDGSSQFATRLVLPGQQWGFFPSVSVGWRVSEEPFIKKVSALKFIDQLKLRASYGETGDDNVERPYSWVAGLNYPATGSGNAEKGWYNGYVPGYMIDGVFVYASAPKSVPEPGISWYTNKVFDAGVDFEGWKGLFGFSFDYFDRRRSGLFAQPSGMLQSALGVEAPWQNLNSDRHFGLELELTHRNRVGEFSYSVKGMASIARHKWLTDVRHAPGANSYDTWRNENTINRYQGIQWIYEGAGRFTSWEDIRNWPLYKGNDVLPGDYKYVDWNGDGEITDADKQPIAIEGGGNANKPWLNYSINLSGAWRGLDFSMLWQGTALGTLRYEQPLYEPWGIANGGGALEMFLDRWHPSTPLAVDEDPYDPSIEWVPGHFAFTGRRADADSDFNRVSSAYLRLKSIELGYTLPKIKSMPTASLRVFANAYNLLTITKVKFIDPEHPTSDSNGGSMGRLYPLTKTFTLGASLTF